MAKVSIRVELERWRAALNRAQARAVADGERVVAAATHAVFGAAVRATPVHRRLSERDIRLFRRVGLRVRKGGPVKGASGGRARGAWRLDKIGPLTWEVANNLPYITVLEFGGYPVRVTRGGAVTFGGAPPGPRTRRAPGGEPSMVSNVSHQAPHGMLRLALRRVKAQLQATGRA